MRTVQLVGVKQLEMVEAEPLRAGANKLLMKVERCGICGSDLHIWENGQPLGLIMGHEFSGIVADPGEADGVFKAGDHITALPSNPCGTCSPCRDNKFNLCARILDDAPGITTPGAYAEYVLVNTAMARKLPDAMSTEEGAMIEPAAIALRAINRAQIAPGDKVLIIGAGIIGLLCAAWARICGASYIALSEMNKSRRSKALQYGDLDEAFDGADPKLQKKLLTITGGGFDKVFECAGPAPAVRTALGAAGPEGVIVLVGINYHDVPVSTMRIAMKELQIKGSYGYLPSEFDLAMDYMARKVLKTERFIDDIIGLHEVQNAFVRLTDPVSDAVKIMIKP